MRIRHSRLTKDFLQVPNATVRDDRMSHMARGILVELLSRPDGWKTTCDDMWQASVAKHGKDSPGRRQFRAAFAELKKYGYLQSERELLEGGLHATVLVVQDVSAAQPDVPHAGTSVPPAQTQETAGQSDVPHGGTSEGATDVPDAGTSERPAETGIDAAQPDVPPTGTSVPPAETGIRAAHSDVPHGGTSKEEHWEKKTGLKNTSSSVAVIGSQQADEDHLSAFGAFWSNYPKKIHMAKAKTEWIAAIRRGVEPALMVSKAQSYAREVAGKDQQYTSYPANWLANERYHDEYPEPAPDGRPDLHVVDSRKHQPFRLNPNANYANGF
ncbi:hypothetical protein [Streptomyces katrae]|uniref:hypothetical protein n=1 Tax=Streptomyces katrae TaxID=68223 RepID=UPI000AD7C93A|nr:hypothetical protein [Streptomyces katrae]